MTKRCIIHPDNECDRGDGPQAVCVCAPPGMKHSATCAARGGQKCDCMVLHVDTPGHGMAPLVLAMLANRIRR